MVYDSPEAVSFSNNITEMVSYYAIEESVSLAIERGTYPNYNGSLWDQGRLPMDTYEELMDYRDTPVESYKSNLNWDALKDSIKQHGIRNGLLMAVAPTACVTGDTLILTDKGLLPIVDIPTTPIGEDDTFTEIDISIIQESDTAVSNNFYNNGISEVYNMVTTEGTEVKATPSHKLRVLTDEGHYVWKPMSEIQAGDLIVKRLGGHEELLGYTGELNQEYIESLTLAKVQGASDRRLVEKMSVPINILKSNTAVVTSYLHGLLSEPSTTFKYKYILIQVKTLLESIGYRSIITKNAEDYTLTFATPKLRAKFSAMSMLSPIKSMEQDYLDNRLGTLDNDALNQELSLAIRNESSTELSQEDTDLLLLLTKGDVPISVLYKQAIRFKDKTPLLYELLKSNNLFFETCSDIYLLAGMSHTYDISVPTNNTYLANGVVSHNTIANITGTTPAMEPVMSNNYIAENLSGKFTVTNKYLIEDLRANGLLTRDIVNSIRDTEGCVTWVNELPQWIKDKYKTSFEIHPKWVILHAAARQRWLDQAQSTNVFMGKPTGDLLEEVYTLAWKLGLKSTYYLRTVAAGSIHAVETVEEAVPQLCSIDDPRCDSCQ